MPTERTNRQTWKTVLLFLLLGLCCDEVAPWSPHRHPSTTTRVYASEAADVSVEFKIRDSLYGDLPSVSALMVTSFYPPEKANDQMWKHLYRLAELNRLQKAFPYPPDQDKHRMLVAVSLESNEIVGFCDIDSRVPLQPLYTNNPTPYLSDVLVDPKWRRRGIARRLIEMCETICIEQFQSNEIYIRVKEENEAAMELYKRLDYRIISSPGDPPEIKMLRKDLTSSK